MSSLQIGLLVIGAILVIAVYGYNIMQERRIRRRMDAAFKTTADPLLESAPSPESDLRERVEPTLAALGDATDVGIAPIASQPPSAPSPVEAAPFEDNRGSAPLSNEPAGGALPDPDVECVARLQAVQPIPGVLLMDAVEADYPKPCRWIGRETSGAWNGIRAGEAYTEVAACMVLADRSGALTAAGYAQFRAMIEDLAHALPAAFIIAEHDEEIERAAALDAFCADVDIQIGLNLLRRDGGRWTGTRLRGVAEASGFKLNGSGQFDYVSDDTGIIQYRMQNREELPLLAESMKLLATGGITLLLDVPRVPEPVKAYDNMRALAKRLATTLDAELVDDNSRPLTDAGLGSIRSSLQEVQGKMRAKGIEPGSPRALRLFA